MAMKFCDGLDRYGASADLDLRWIRAAGTPTYSTTGGLTGVGAINVAASSRVQTRDTFTATLSSGGNIHVAFWMKATALQAGGAGDRTIFTLGSNLQGVTSGNAIRMDLSDTQQIKVTGHGASTVLATSSAGAILLNQHHHIEYAGKYADAGGFIKVWVDRILVIDFSGDTLTSTQPSTITQMQFQDLGATLAFLLDDPIIWDETGSDFVHTQLGASYAHVIETLSTDADDSVQFTPSASTNESNIDDAAFHDGDTTYNESSTVGHVDRFTVTDQASTPAATFAVVQHTIARKTDAGGATLHNRIVSGAATQESADFVLTTTFAHYCDYTAVGKDPNTSAAWGTTAVNSVKAGYEYQA